MNPMIRKELRQRMRDRRAWLLPSLYLLVLSATVVLSYYFSAKESSDPEFLRRTQGADVGTAFFLTAAYAQLAVLLLIAPVFSSGGLTIEKEQRTLSALLTSLLSPTQIWWGKLVTALLYQTLLLISALPILALAFAFGGVSPQMVGAVTGTTLLILTTISSVGLYCSSFFRRSVHATAVTYALVIGMMLMTAIASALFSAGTREFVQWPLYLNPFFTLTVSLSTEADHLRSWLISLSLFLALGSLAAVLAVRNISRSGESA